MIKDIQIERFRGFQSLNISDFGQFNVIVGENNSGKSSLLEALLLMGNPNNPSLCMLVDGLRDWKQTKDSNDATLLFYKRQFEIPITLSVDFDTMENREIQIHLFQEQINTVNLEIEKKEPISNLSPLDYGYQIEARVQNEFGIQDLQSRLTYKRDDKKVQITFDPHYGEHLNMHYVASRHLNVSDQGFDKMVEHKEKSILINALQLLEPELKDIVRIDKQLFVDLGFEQMLPINVLGDGFRTILSLVSLVYASQGGILLVDEIDNGLHYSSMKAMWKVLFQVAQAYQVQLIATSHNLDSIRAYNAILETNKDIQDKARIFALRRLSANQSKAYKYVYEQFNYLLKEEVELR